MPDLILAGAAIVDVPVVPADASVFSRVSTPAEHIMLTTGGDAMNEAMVLSRLGKQVRLITRIGTDDAGRYIKQTCIQAGIDTSHFLELDELATGVNVVLVDASGERRFFTNPHGSLRALEAQDITPQAVRGASIFCFASIFVFPKINPEQLAQLFARVRKQGLLVCADMTLPKHGERLPEMAPAFAQLDYLFANEAEAGAVTEESDPVRMADRLISAGACHVIIKLGANGCLLADQTGLRVQVPACPDTHCIDTTGAGDTFAAGFFAGLLDGRSVTAPASHPCPLKLWAPRPACAAWNRFCSGITQHIHGKFPIYSHISYAVCYTSSCNTYAQKIGRDDTYELFQSIERRNARQEH